MNQEFMFEVGGVYESVKEHWATVFNGPPAQVGLNDPLTMDQFLAFVINQPIGSLTFVNAAVEGLSLALRENPHARGRLITNPDVPPGFTTDAQTQAEALRWVRSALVDPDAAAKEVSTFAVEKGPGWSNGDDIAAALVALLALGLHAFETPTTPVA